MRLLTGIAGLLLALPAAWAEAPPPASPPPEEKPRFAVLKVIKGDEVGFRVVAHKDIAAEKARILQESKVERAGWKAERAAFLKDKANKGREYEVPMPALAKVVVVKDFIPSEEAARRYAEERQKKADEEREEERRKKRQKPKSGGGGTPADSNDDDDSGDSGDASGGGPFGGGGGE